MLKQFKRWKWDRCIPYTSQRKEKEPIAEGWCFFFLTNCWHFCQKFFRIRSHGYFESYAFSDIYWLGLYHYFSHFMFSANPDCCMQVLRKPISEKTNRKRINIHLLFETDAELCSRHYVFFVVIPYHWTYTYTNGSFHCLGNKWSKLRLNYELPKAAC